MPIPLVSKISKAPATPVPGKDMPGTVLSTGGENIRRTSANWGSLHEGSSRSKSPFGGKALSRNRNHAQKTGRGKRSLEQVLNDNERRKKKQRILSKKNSHRKSEECELLV